MKTSLLGAGLRLVVYACIVFVLLTPAMAQSAQPANAQQGGNVVHYPDAVPKTPADYQPITAGERLSWFARATVGPKSLAGGLFSAGFGTATNSPHEYGPHWEGFGKRYGMRLTGVSTSNAMEATLGAIWGEDPRYFHTIHQSFGGRVKNIVDLTFRAYHPDGERYPAYARYVAIVGNNFLSNTWRAHSEADSQHAMIRVAEGIGGRALSNAFDEFFPLLWRKVTHQPDPYPANERRP